MAASNVPQTPLVNLQTGYVTQTWLYWLQNPQIQTIVIGSPIQVVDGGTGLTGGISGGIPAFIGPTTMASSAELEANQIVLGGGAGLTPYTLGDLGTTSKYLRGNALGAPTWESISGSDFSSDQNIIANDVFHKRRQDSTTIDQTSISFNSAQNIIANQIFGY